MGKDKQEQGMGLQEIGLNLDDLVRRGARQVIQQAIEAELAQLLEQYENVRTLHGRRAVVRNGYLPEREVLTGAGPLAVKVPKVRDRSSSGVKFNSAIVPPYVRKSPRVNGGAIGGRGRNPPGFLPRKRRASPAETVVFYVAVDMNLAETVGFTVVSNSNHSKSFCSPPI